MAKCWRSNCLVIEVPYRSITNRPKANTCISDPLAPSVQAARCLAEGATSARAAA